MIKESTQSILTQELVIAGERARVLERGKSMGEVLSELEELFDDTPTQLLRGVKNGDFYWEDAFRVYGDVC